MVCSLQNLSPDLDQPMISTGSIAARSLALPLTLSVTGAGLLTTLHDLTLGGLGAGAASEASSLAFTAAHGIVLEPITGSSERIVMKTAIDPDEFFVALGAFVESIQAEDPDITRVLKDKLMDLL